MKCRKCGLLRCWINELYELTEEEIAIVEGVTK